MSHSFSSVDVEVERESALPVFTLAVPHVETAALCLAEGWPYIYCTARGDHVNATPAEKLTCLIL